MGRYTQNTLSADITEPVELDEMRDHLIVEHNEHDSYISLLIPAARKVAENYIDGVISDREYTLYLDNFEQIIELPFRPVDIGSIAIAYTDDDDAPQTIADYALEWLTFSVKVKPACGASWPTIETGKDKVQITFTAGYDAAFNEVPPDMKHAIMMIGATLYDQREDHTAAVELKNVPTSSRLLLDAYRKVTV